MVATLLLISICWFSATLERVIDGDTYQLRVELGFDMIARVTIRLADLDTPERFTPEGKAAKEAIEMRFRDCPIEVQPTGDRTFARWVAHVRACGADVASWLRAAGHEKP
jgi:endonuclease YncB( thermonuclease family)